MPLRLDIKKKLSARSDRVKSVDFHPTEPWVLSGLYSGNVFIWDYNNQTLVKSIEVSKLPVRCAKFVIRKQWIIAGCDDMSIRVYNHNTLEKVKVLEAHTDYIRFIAVHPSMSYMLSASDDMTVKLWDWDKNWSCLATFEGHAHYVMMVQWNPKDTNIFASASLDRTIKVWGVTNTSGAASVVATPHFTLTGHERGVNCIEYAPSGEKPYIVSGSDDRTVRVWDYQTKQCLQVLSGHTNNVSAAIFHPQLPIIISGSEDGSVKIWHSATYRLETTMSHMMERVWSLSSIRGSNNVAIGYDEGTMVLKLGSEEPIASMTQQGKIVWAKGSDIQTANLKLVDDTVFSDGERIQLSIKDMGSCEIFPQSVAHHPNGRLFAVCGDGEYIIYTAQALRNKSFGPALELVWSSEGHYATKDANNKITVFHNFKEHFSFKPPFPVEEMFGGNMISLKSAEYVCFYDWNEYRFIRRIDVVPRAVYWSESANTQVCLACADSFFILRHDKAAMAKAIEARNFTEEEGIEAAFELVTEVNDKVDSGLWVAECFVYVTQNMRLQCFVAGQIETLAHLDRPLYLLGYMPEQNRLYLIDKELSVVSYLLHIALVEYQSAVSRKDDAAAEVFFQQIPQDLHSRVARFLEHQGYKEKALDVTRDPDHKFELALSLGRLQQCAEIIRLTAADATTPQATLISRWKQLGDVALEQGSFRLALGCFQEAKDFSGILLILSATGDAEGMRQLAALTAEAGKSNIAVLCHFLLQDPHSCLKVLLSAGRLPEAAFFARTYCPSQVSSVVSLWKEDLRKINQLVADSLADPVKYPDLFPEMAAALKAEEIMTKRREFVGYQPASEYSSLRQMLDMDLVKDINTLGAAQVERMFLGDAVLNDADINTINNVSHQAPPPRAQPAVKINGGISHHGDSPVHRGQPSPVKSQPPPAPYSPVAVPPPQAQLPHAVKGESPKATSREPSPVAAAPQQVPRPATNDVDFEDLI